MKPSHYLCLGFYFLINISARMGQLLVFDDVTIYDQSVTWNEAKDLCERHGQTMLTMESEEKFNVLNNRMSLLGFDLLTGDFWFGLHDVLNGSGTAFYWHDCEPLSPTDWGQWDPIGNEPDNPINQRCVRIFFGKWRTVECNKPRRYICEARKDHCPYMYRGDMAAVQNSSTLFIDLNADENSCLEVCNNMYTASTSCWGVMTYGGNSSTCTLVMAKETPSLQASPGIGLHMKDCMKVSVNALPVAVQSQPNMYPTSNCTSSTPSKADYKPRALLCRSFTNPNVTNFSLSTAITTTEGRGHVSQEELLLSIQIIKDILTVNKSGTSSEIRKKISVYETRTGAVSMGLIGTIIIVIVVLCPVISDITSIMQRRHAKKQLHVQLN